MDDEEDEDVDMDEDEDDEDVDDDEEEEEEEEEGAGGEVRSCHSQFSQFFADDGSCSSPLAYRPLCDPGTPHTREAYRLYIPGGV